MASVVHESGALDDVGYYGDESDCGWVGSDYGFGGSSNSSLAEADEDFKQNKRMKRGISPRRKKFFRRLPSRKKTRRLIMPRPARNNLYHTSRWLHQYFLTQNGLKKGSAIVDVDSSAKSDGTSLLKLRQDVPQVTPGRHIIVEEAVDFSQNPRILIESDMPHRVVHANAAYARHYGSSPSNTPNLFKAPHVESHRELAVAVSSLFDSTDSLIMYPVWGSELGSGRLVTHYLVEANAQVPTMIASTLMKNSWQQEAAQAIA